MNRFWQIMMMSGGLWVTFFGWQEYRVSQLARPEAADVSLLELEKLEVGGVNQLVENAHVRFGPCLALYPALCELRDARQLSAERIASAIAASAEGYSFPTNLDRDPPIGGLAPQSQQQLLSQAMDERWDVDTFREHLLSHAERRIA